MDLEKLLHYETMLHIDSALKNQALFQIYTAFLEKTRHLLTFI